MHKANSIPRVSFIAAGVCVHRRVPNSVATLFAPSKRGAATACEIHALGGRKYVPQVAPRTHTPTLHAPCIFLFVLVVACMFVVVCMCYRTARLHVKGAHCTASTQSSTSGSSVHTLAAAANCTLHFWSLYPLNCGAITGAQRGGCLRAQSPHGS